MSHSTPLLRPMGADALLRKPPKPGEKPFVLPPEYAHPPAYCSPAPPPAQEDELDALLEASFPAEEDDDASGPDYMPTERMPIPVSVPLYDLSLPEKKRGKGWIIALIAAVAAAALCTLGYWQREWIAELIGRFAG